MDVHKIRYTWQSNLNAWYDTFDLKCVASRTHLIVSSTNTALYSTGTVLGNCSIAHSTMAFIAATPLLLQRSQVSISSRKQRVISIPSHHGGCKSKIVMKASGGGYWRGEWVCVDCGFIYKPGRKVKFEDLSGDWKCPQCNAPKRRFAKKAGDYVQETASTSNTPIIAFSILGLIGVILFGFWASSNL